MFLTRKQREAVFTKYLRNPDGAKSYGEFRRRVQLGFGGDYILLPWCGMFVGIEGAGPNDGYAHT